MIALPLLLTSLTVQANIAIQTQISGLPAGGALKNATLALEKLQNKFPIKDETNLYSFANIASNEIQKAVKPFGYFSSQIDFNKIKKNNKWIINFKIKPGPVVTISEVTISIVGEARNNNHFTKLLTNLPIKPGQPLNTKKYENLKERLSDISATFGYLNAKLIQNKIIINLNTHKAKIIIRFDSGNRSRFGKAMLSNSKLEKSYLRKFLAFKPGDYYNSNKIQQTQKNLVNSGYFSKALVSPIINTNDKTIVPVKILLTEGNNQKYTFGLGYGTDTGPRGTAGVQFNQINKYGHKFNTLLQAAQYNSSLVFNYLIPYPNPLKNLITLSGGFGYMNIDAGQSNFQKISTTYSTNFGAWKQNIALTALHEKYNITTITVQKTNATMLYPSIQWAYNKKDDTLNPHNGFDINFSLLGTPNFLTANSGFIQARIESKFLYTFKPTHTRLLTHTTLARTNINNLINLPLSLQLIAGGTQSIRGFDNNIGPGKNLATASIELQQRIYGNWYISGFCDAGNVTQRSGTSQYDNYFKTIDVGAGPAIVWLSPVGMAELTLGYKIFANGVYQKAHNPIIQFSMGPYL